MISGSDATQPRRRLVADKLNVVGETHTESDLRRDAEKQFTLAKTGSPNYWTEAEFLDMYQKVGIRTVRSGQGQPQGDPAADLMEFRAVHGAAILITRFEKLADEAGQVATTPLQSAAKTVYDFVNVKIREYNKVRDRIANSWRPTASDTVNKAVQAVYTYVDGERQKYLVALRDAPPEQQLKATKDLAGSRAALRDLVPALEKAVGAPSSADRSAAKLAQDMRRQRSATMGLAAAFIKQVGVWKVGDLHIADLTDGTVKVDASRMNFISKEDFNDEFETWQREKHT